MKRLTHSGTTVLDQAYESLKQSIVGGAYRPGQRLKALRIAKELGISRTPIKEALGRLEKEGLVEREIDFGYVVRGLSVQDILNLYRVREVLEVEAAREALPKLTAEAIEEMRRALDRADLLLKQKRYNDFLRLNRKFHNVIVAQTQNSVLQEMLTNLDARFWSIGTIVVSRYPQRVESIRQENRSILNALVSGDSRVVERSVRAHVLGAANHVKAVLEREPQHLLISAA